MTMVNGNDKVRKSTSETLGKDPVQMGELEFNTTTLAIFKQHLGQEAFFSKNVRELGSQVPDFWHVCWTTMDKLELTDRSEVQRSFCEITIFFQ